MNFTRHDIGFIGASRTARLLSANTKSITMLTLFVIMAGFATDLFAAGKAPKVLYASWNYSYFRSVEHEMTDPGALCQAIFNYNAPWTWTRMNDGGPCTTNRSYAGTQADMTPGYIDCLGRDVGTSDACLPPSVQPFDIVYPVGYVCDPGSEQGDGSTKESDGTVQDRGQCYGIQSCKDCQKGDPVDTLVGNEMQTATDYAGAGAFPIRFERVYNSSGLGAGRTMGAPWIFVPGLPHGVTWPNAPFTWSPFSPPPDWVYVPISAQNQSIHQLAAPGVPTPPIASSSMTNVKMDGSWRLNYDRTLTMQVGSYLTAVLYTGNSDTRSFNRINGAWVPSLSEHMTSLTQQSDANGNATGFIYINENDEKEQYNTSGQLLSITNRAGLAHTLQYIPGPNSNQPVLHSITDTFGHVLTLNYDVASRLSGFVDPSGGKYVYGYDSNNNLTSVTYPDGSIRRYVYENATLPTAITGVIDENGNRFSTLTYDTSGNAIGSQLAGGAERVTFNYDGAPANTSSTDANGLVSSYSTKVVDGYTRLAGVSQNCGTNCVRTIAINYDANGNVSSRSDYNGNVTTYNYDLTRDLETSRTEASGTAQARTITTQWHPIFRLPTQITEPGRTSLFNYDANGNLLGKTVSANGSNRNWTYTYNSNGQILTVTGPRTDVSDVTNYAYDSYGNLASIANALGQVTTLSNYDANGRVGLITDPNGATTTFTYAPRGWLTSKVVTAGTIVQSTSYSYDNAGQLIHVTLPDNASVSYTYDAAHRLTKIQDSLGNSINYTLDLMDNRTAETVNDPNGVLTRQVSRIYDTVNRLQQVTGAAQ